MKRRAIRGFWAMLMLTLGLSLVSCSGQQQEQEDLEQEEQGLDGNEDVDEQEGNNDFNQENQGNFNNDFGQGNDDNLQLNQGDMQNFGGDSLLANEASQDGASNTSENDLSNIISEMNQLSPEGGEPVANNMMQENQSDAASGMVEQTSPPMSGAGLVTGIAGEPAGDGLPEMGSKLSYIVVSGDTLGKISSKIFGSSERWQELAENSGIENPSKIYPGDIVYYQLTEESIAFVNNYQTLARQEVTVQKGDTLATIAKEFYGDSKQWKYIWRQNGQIMNPHKVKIGTKLYFVKKNAGIALSHKVENMKAQQLDEVKSVSHTKKLQAKTWSLSSKSSV